MRLSVLPRSPDEPERLVYRFRRDVVRIGRRRSADVHLPDRAVSLDHARILRSGAGFTVIDGGSTNGTRVGSRRVDPGQPCVLRTGDILHLGPFSLLFEVDQASDRAETTSEETALFARRILRRTGPDDGGPYVEVVGGAEEGARLRLQIREGDAPYRIGRSPDCDLALTDPDASRDHVALVRDFAGVRARDLGSKNGLLLNGRPASGEPRLTHGDEIRVGATRLRFVDPIEERLRALEQLGEEPPPEPWRGERVAVVLAASALAGCVATWIWLIWF